MKREFTMIEMVVVVLFIAMLAAIATPMYFSYLKDAKVTMAKNQIRLFSQAVLDYQMRIGKLPSEEYGLSALVANPDNNPRWRPFLNSDSVPLDPWGNEYVYKLTGDGGYEILCYGEDGKAGGEGDAADISSLGK